MGGRDRSDAMRYLSSLELATSPETIAHV
jgi:hypothetical protein